MVRLRSTTALFVVAAAYGGAVTLALIDGVRPVVAAQAAPAPGQAPAQKPSSPNQADASGAPQASATVVGDESCLGCHEDQGPNIRQSVHGNASHPRTPAASGNTCESCHGPGSAHVEDPSVATSIRRFDDTMAPRAASEACLACHTRGSHVLWTGSVHDARNLSCATCHSSHQPKSDRAQLRTETAMQTCATCHRQQTTKLQRSGHMPLREGKMECSSCHDPHGATNVRLLRVGNWINESCASCHTEKRGPFLWEHAAGREACSTCHDPHGSNHDRLLVSKLPMLCQRCHIGTRHPSTIYDGAQLAARSNRLIGRSCVNCHSQIHGSNSPAGHTFLR